MQPKINNEANSRNHSTEPLWKGSNRFYSNNNEMLKIKKFNIHLEIFSHMHTAHVNRP